MNKKIENNIMESKIKKEIEISKKEKFSKKRALIIFVLIFFLIIFLMAIWGGIKHKETGVVPSDFKVFSD